MTTKSDGIGRALTGGLRLSADATFEREKAAEAERADYRRRYWQKYSKRVRRIFGTVTPDEYAAIAVRAEATQDGEPSVWRQIWLESRAYVAGSALPTAEIAEQQRELLGELRRIGNNIKRRGMHHFLSNGLLCGARAESAVSTKAEREVVRAVASTPVVSTKVIALQAAMSPQAINAAARRLNERGLIAEATGNSRFRLWKAQGG